MFPVPIGLRRPVRLLAACLLAVAAAVLALGTPVAVNTAAAASLPCDIYAAGGTPCATAHSTTRALFASYNGPLYQIQRKSDQKYLDIGLLSAGGVADAAPQVSFCAGTSCTITKIYDQTANHNDLPISWGGLWKGPGPNGADIGADAMALPVTMGGHPAYGIKSTQGTGYRVDHAKGVPTGSQPGRHLHGDLLELREPVVLFRLRQRRELPHRHRQRDHERDRVGHRLLVRRMRRERPVGGGRPGERHVPHRHRLQ
ncbi:hypothetical protein GCM10029978_043530 [Actinoallomurus acanthiterrae]